MLRYLVNSEPTIENILNASVFYLKRVNISPQILSQALLFAPIQSAALWQMIFAREKQLVKNVASIYYSFEYFAKYINTVKPKLSQYLRFQLTNKFIQYIQNLSKK